MAVSTLMRHEIGSRKKRTAPKVMVLGLRGIPNVQGGIETHVRMLYPLLARLGYRIEVIQRSPYFPRKDRKHRWHGLRLTYLWAPRVHIVETAVHTLFGVLYAAVTRPDVVHLHGIGPGLLTPLARLLGLRVVVTHHTFDYRREKWGAASKATFAAGERCAMIYANGIVAVTDHISSHILEKYRRRAALIPNGTKVAIRSSSKATLDCFGLSPSRYVLCVGRFERTKRHIDLIDAFERASTSDWKLALVGALDQTDEYMKSILIRRNENPQIVLTDYQTGTALRELYSWAGLFVLSSSHEGQPIALLEAASYGIPCVASAIPANLTIPLPQSCFFPVGDIESLTKLIESAITEPPSQDVWNHVRATVRTHHDWKKNARSTAALYERVLEPPAKKV